MDKLFERADDIMNGAVEKAGEFLMNKPEISEILLKQVLKCDPDHFAAIQLLGLCKHRLGKNVEAIEMIKHALDLDGSNSDNWNNLGLAYGALRNFDKGIDCIKKAIDLNPRQFLFKNNLALQYRSLGNYEYAVKYMLEAIEVEEKPQLWLNLGGIYGEMKDTENSKKCFYNALRLEPEYPAAYIDLAFAYYLEGNWKKGFEAYEWRFWYYPQMKFYHESYDMEKLWDGKADLNGKRVLIYGEQGVGDIIQFIRYAKNLKKLGAYVIIHCPISLSGLFKNVEGIDEINNRDIVNNTGDKFPEYDYQLSIMSFPYLLNLDEIDGSPYIKPTTDAFKEHLIKEYPNTLKIGIVWAGSPAHPNDKKRSIPLKYFEPLSKISGVKLFNLQLDTRPRQYGATYRDPQTPVKDSSPLADKFLAEEDIVDYNKDCDNLKIVDLTKMIQSFEDTATILAGLDMVICCDTAVAHLAGAMGIPTWIAIPYNPDWRWTFEGDKTHWYDSVTLFRQEKAGDWESVFKKIENNLKAYSNEVVL